TAAAANPSPFAGTWESPMTGYVSTSPVLTGTQGTISTNALGSFTIQALGLATVEGNPFFILVMDTSTPVNAFSALTVLHSASVNTYTAAGAAYYPVGS